MAYVRKTKDVFEVQVNYGYGHGFECVYTEETRKEARERIKEYQENAPEYAVRIVCKRVKISG